MDRNGFGYDVNGIAAGRMRRRWRDWASKRPDGTIGGGNHASFRDMGYGRCAEDRAGDRQEVRRVASRHEGAGRGLCRRIRSEAGRRIRRTNPPDVMYMWDFPTYHQSLEPLDGYASKDEDLNIDDFTKDCSTMARSTISCTESRPALRPGSCTTTRRCSTMRASPTRATDGHGANSRKSPRS